MKHFYLTAIFCLLTAWAMGQKILLIGSSSDCKTQQRVDEIAKLSCKAFVTESRWDMYKKNGFENARNTLLSECAYILEILTADMSRDRTQLNITFYKIRKVGDKSYDYSEIVDITEPYVFPGIDCEASPPDKVIRKFQEWLETRVTYLLKKHELPPLVELKPYDISGTVGCPDEVIDDLENFPMVLKAHEISKKFRFYEKPIPGITNTLFCIAKGTGNNIKVRVSLDGDLQQKTALTLYDANIIRRLLDELNAKFQ